MKKLTLLILAIIIVLILTAGCSNSKEVDRNQKKATENLSSQQNKVDPLAYNNIGKFDLSNVSSSEIIEKQRLQYREWHKNFIEKIANYKELDSSAVKIMEDFKSGKINKSSRTKVNSVWQDMDVIRDSLLNIDCPKGFSLAIDDELWRMAADYQGGINDRMAGLWQIVMYCDGDLTLSEAKIEVDSCLKTSGDFFVHYEKRQREFHRIFGD